MRPKRSPASVVLRHDLSLNTYFVQDAFLFFMNMEEKGIQLKLIKAAKEWRTLNESALTQPPLRNHLFQILVQELINRVDHIAKCDAQSQLWTSLTARQVVMTDGSWPYVAWNVNTKKLEVTNQKPIPMSQMIQDLQTLGEMCTVNTNIIRFHAMKTTTSSSTSVKDIPWRLQVTMRCLEIYQMLH